MGAENDDVVYPDFSIAGLAADITVAIVLTPLLLIVLLVGWIAVWTVGLLKIFKL